MNMTRLSALIARAHDDMTEYQERFLRDPGHARVSVAGVAHALVPTQVLASELPAELTEILGAELAPTVMYRLGRLIGAGHAAAFFANRSIGLDEPQYRVLTGPFHFAWAGYGDVQLLLWEPHLNSNFLVLWESDNSFSALESINHGHCKRSCELQAGYAAGWASEATGLNIEVIEIACCAEGVAYCRFVMAHEELVSAHITDPRLHRPTRQYRVMPVSMSRPAIP